jgi:hypothetical protein
MGGDVTVPIPSTDYNFAVSAAQVALRVALSPKITACPSPLLNLSPHQRQFPKVP